MLDQPGIEFIGKARPALPHRLAGTVRLVMIEAMACGTPVRTLFSATFRPRPSCAISLCANDGAFFNLGCRATDRTGRRTFAADRAPHSAWRSGHTR